MESRAENERSRIHSKMFMQHIKQNAHPFFQTKMSGNTGIGKMHMDLYTNNAALTQKAKFWCNFVSSLKGKASQLGIGDFGVTCIRIT